MDRRRENQTRNDILDTEEAGAISDIKAVSLLAHLDDGVNPDTVAEWLREAIRANGY